MKQKIQITGEHDKDYQVSNTNTNSDSVIPTGKAISDIVGTVYHAYLAGNTTTPVVLLNTTGATCTVTNPSTGLFTFTFDSAVLTTNKTSVQATCSRATSMNGGVVAQVHGSVTSTTVADVYVGHAASGSGASASSNAYPFEIKITIYN